MNDHPDPVGDVLYNLAAEIRRAEQLHITDDELVDFVGTLGNLTTRLRDLRSKHLTEIPGPRQGEAYRSVERRSAKRTYNTQAILSEVLPVTDSDLAPALWLLMEAGAVRMQWQWTRLRDFLTRHNLPLTIVPHEISDGDPDAMVGEVWETKITIEGLER